MKKLILLSMIAVGMPIQLFAQDDMYFVPTRELAEQTEREYGMPRDTYYIGSRRSVDEYNRRGSHYEVIDSLGDDTIDFDGIAGVYPDSTYTEPEDYRYTRRMSRFDGYEPSSDYWAGYYDGSRLWHSPWYLNGWYYAPGRYSWYAWSDPWYDPGMIPGTTAPMAGIHPGAAVGTAVIGMVAGVAAGTVAIIPITTHQFTHIVPARVTMGTSATAVAAAVFALVTASAMAVAVSVAPG